VTGFSPGREGELLKNVQMPDFRIVEIPEMVRELSPLNDWKALRRLRRFFKEEKFDVVHTHSSKAGLLGRLAAHKAKIPCVVHTVHGQAFHPYQSKLKNHLFIFLERFAAKYCDKIYAVAQAMIDQCVAAKVAPREKYMVVYSGMDTTAFDHAVREEDLRNKLGIPENAKTICTVARLFHQKGYEFIIPAAEKVLASMPDVHFLFVGDGPMYDDLNSYLKSKNIDKNFHFAGLVPPSEVCRYIAQSDLLWHLSLHEGLPRAVVQALATGIPAIGFALDGTPEVIINGETGYTTNAEDIEAVTCRTLELFQNDDLRRSMGAKGKEKVLKQFDWQLMADILEKEFLTLYNIKTKVTK
jgi:glycosyltransferase involved in cell wall biosynthesis